jgi:hypothetical protein
MSEYITAKNARPAKLLSLKTKLVFVGVLSVLGGDALRRY